MQNGAADCQASAEKRSRKAKSIVCNKCSEVGQIGRVCTAEVDKMSKPAHNCFRCGIEGHITRDCTVKLKAKTKCTPPTCYNCHVEGHLTCDSTAEAVEATQKTKRAAQICYSCNEEGHLARKCTAETSAKPQDKKRSAPICYNCKEEGHFARDCEAPGVSINNTNNRPARDSSSRNRHCRRAHRDRIANRIKVTDNGEGLRTCDREVRKGELTRTGLVI
jgi:hypothetical protein